MNLFSKMGDEGEEGVQNLKKMGSIIDDDGRPQINNLKKNFL